MDLNPGDVFVGHVIKREIGRGGMGAIYLALDPQIDRHVAIKLMNPGLVRDPMFLERFRKEARILGKFAHPHIVHIYGYGESQGQLWMAMQFVQAGSDADGLPTALDLGQRMTQAPLSVPDGLHILQGVARALDYVHAQGLVHRDLKPANILLDASGEAYLADFGIAKLLENTVHSTAAIGTPHYMSPEQCSALVIGPPADIYALGVLAYQWLAQQLPFGANTKEPVAIAMAHLQQPMPEAPLTRWPPAVTTVLRQALAKQADDRPGSARAFIDALTAALVPSASARELPNNTVADAVPVAANKLKPASKRWIVPTVVLFATAASGFGLLAYKHYKSPIEIDKKATLVIKTDTTCQLSINGEDRGILEAQATQRLPVDLGEQLIVCVGADRRVEQTETVEAGRQSVVQLTLPPPAPPGRFERVSEGVKDNEQNLIWAERDNGSDINWTNARQYCSDLGSSWTLPSSVALHSLHGANTTLIKGTGFLYWTNEQNGSSEAWGVNLFILARESYPVVFTSLSRALCVRRF